MVSNFGIARHPRHVHLAGISNRCNLEAAAFIRQRSQHRLDEASSLEHRQLLEAIPNSAAIHASHGATVSTGPEGDIATGRSYFDLLNRGVQLRPDEDFLGMGAAS
jgi:hypothetical protein